MAACSSTRGEQRGSTELCSLVAGTGPEGMAWGCDTGGSDWVLRNSSSPERLWHALNRLPEAVVTDPNPTEFKVHLDNALRNII